MHTHQLVHISRAPQVVHQEVDPDAATELQGVEAYDDDDDDDDHDDDDDDDDD